jgi:hypothetical protein
MTPVQQQILSYLRAHIGKPCPTNADMVHLIGIETQHIGKVVNSLAKKGYIRIESLGGRRSIHFPDGTSTLITQRLVAPTSVSAGRTQHMNGIYRPTAICSKCGASSLHGCRHMSAAA